MISVITNKTKTVYKYYAIKLNHNQIFDGPIFAVLVPSFFQLGFTPVLFEKISLDCTHVWDGYMDRDAFFESSGITTQMVASLSGKNVKVTTRITFLLPRIPQVQNGQLIGGLDAD